jgi:hypothetical protein
MSSLTHLHICGNISALDIPSARSLLPQLKHLAVPFTQFHEEYTVDNLTTSVSACEGMTQVIFFHPCRERVRDSSSVLLALRRRYPYVQVVWGNILEDASDVGIEDKLFSNVIDDLWTGEALRWEPDIWQLALKHTEIWLRETKAASQGKPRRLWTTKFSHIAATTETRQ